MEEKAVCLLSGGLDSCVSTYIAKKLGFNIFALTFNYNQQHNKEIKCAKEISNDLKIKNHVIFNLDLDIFKGSILFKGKYKNHNKKLSDIGKEIPLTYVPARNTIFLSIALAYAETVNANNIFIGVNSNDYSGYPDCRPEFIKEFQILADLATKKTVEGNRIIINTPLINLTKSEIIKEGLNLNVPFDKTWSCYKGDSYACGKCESCLLRLKGFKESKIKDKINYESYPNWY
jgi:7-cyano-7-deazaguanine synthase